MKKPKYQKKIEDIDAVIKLLKTITFFKNQKELTYQDYVIICYNLKYEQFSKDQIIFDYNTIGDKFYIVLAGSVTVLIPISINQIPYVFKEVAVLKKGKFFGELALMTNKARLLFNRSDTIKCREESGFAVLDKASYQKVFQEIHKQKLLYNVSLLHQIPFLSEFSQRNLERLTYYFKNMYFVRNQFVFHSGTKAEYVHVILKGSFEVN